MRWLWALPAIVLGGVVGLSGLAVHRHAVWVGGWPLPWGALLGLAAPTALGLWLRGRTPLVLGYALGWAVVVLGALGEGPGGDFLLMSDVLGWGFLGSSVLLIGVVLALGAAAHRAHPYRKKASTR